MKVSAIGDVIGAGVATIVGDTVGAVVGASDSFVMKVGAVGDVSGAGVVATIGNSFVRKVKKVFLIFFFLAC